MMKYNERVLLPEDDGPARIEPMTCLDVECTECKRRWRVPVREEWTDWKLIAEKYRRRNEFLRDQVQALARERDRLRRDLELAKSDVSRLVADVADRYP
jgi:hypothetical protein